MALLAEAAARPRFLDGFGFVLESDGGAVPTYEEVGVRCRVPIVGNLAGNGLICWFEGEVTLLAVGDQTRGLRFENLAPAAMLVSAPRCLTA